MQEIKTEVEKDVEKKKKGGLPEDETKIREKGIREKQRREGVKDDTVKLTRDSSSDPSRSDGLCIIESDFSFPSPIFFYSLLYSPSSSTLLSRLGRCKRRLNLSSVQRNMN